MKLAWLSLSWLLPAAAFAGTLAESILASYDPVRSVVCEIRKDTEGPAGRIRMLSRVFYEKPDRLHVENVSPVHRRIVCDGTIFFSYIDGDPKGFRRPVAELDEEMTVQLRKAPGTAMDHLMKLRGIAETPLPATAEFPLRRGYAAPKVYVVLSADASNRLARIEFFDGPEMRNATGRYEYGSFREALPGVWIPLLHRGHVIFAGKESRETVRIDGLSVNTPIAPNLFVPAPFFPDVTFVSSFEKTIAPLEENR